VLDILQFQGSIRRLSFFFKFLLMLFQEYLMAFNSAHLLSLVVSFIIKVKSGSCLIEDQFEHLSFKLLINVLTASTFDSLNDFDLNSSLNCFEHFSFYSHQNHLSNSNLKIQLFHLYLSMA